MFRVAMADSHKNLHLIGRTSKLVKASDASDPKVYAFKWGEVEEVKWLMAFFYVPS